jgi:toxin ParE1/3/4
MAYRIKLTREAERDLDGIVAYTLQRWGTAQVDRMHELGATIQQLRQKPSRQGRSLDELKPGLRYHRHGKHYFIFYRVEGRQVEIIRILHQRRDWRRLLGPQEDER